MSVAAMEFILHAPTAIIIAIAAKVSCRAIRPWLRLYRVALNIPEINSATNSFQVKSVTKKLPSSFAHYLSEVVVIVICMAGAVGLELTTPGFGNQCSAN